MFANRSTDRSTGTQTGARVVCLVGLLTRIHTVLYRVLCPILKHCAHVHAPCVVTYANVRPVARSHSTSTASLATGLLAVHTGIADAASGVIAADGGPISTRTHGLNVLLSTLQGTPEIAGQCPSSNPHNQPLPSPGQP